MVTWVLLLLFSLAKADLLVRTITVNNVNYEDFSLLCAEGIPLLMEDHKPRPCQPRPWKAEQRCPAGFWCHEGDDESSYYCCPRSRKVSNHCHLPPATGFGKQVMRRFYYDWKTDGCHELHYTGIGGNENSYMTYESCEAECRGVGEPTPKVFGGLSSSTKEDKKNPEKDKGGKNKGKGHTISFTISSTEIPPLSSSKEAVKPIPLTVASSKRVTQTRPITTTTAFIPETTTFVPIEPVENPCVLPLDRGSSGGIARKMWYYDQTSLSCAQFTYQGKDGNANRFESAQRCMTTCGIGKPTRKSCDLSPSIGSGSFKIPRYYFDSKTQRCELFFYSGEEGNDNRFYKKHKCERLCLGKQSKKKEQTRQPEPYTMSPTRIVDNFVSSEPTKPENKPKTPVTFPPFTRHTAPPTNRPTEIVIPSEYTLTVQPIKPEHTHFEKYETRVPPKVVEQLPETTRAPWVTETTTLFYTPPPTTPSDAGFMIRTETSEPVELQTFPTLVYVPKEEGEPGTLSPYFPHEGRPSQKPIDDLFSHLMTVKLPTITEAPAVRKPYQPELYQPKPTSTEQIPAQTSQAKQNPDLSQVSSSSYEAGQGAGSFIQPYPQHQLPAIPQQQQNPMPNYVKQPLQPSQPVLPTQNSQFLPQQPIPPYPHIPGQQPRFPSDIGNLFTTGAPTIVEKSHVGPAPDNHSPSGNFTWETAEQTTFPSVPQLHVLTPEQLESVASSFGANAGSMHQTLVGTDFSQQHVHGIKPVEAPPGSILSIPPRQWATAVPPSYPYIQPVPETREPIQSIPSLPDQQSGPNQPPQQIVLPSLFNVAQPVSSGNQNQPQYPEPRIEISIQSTESPIQTLAPFVPTETQLPGTLPPVFQGPLGSFQPHPVRVTIDQPIPKIVINQVPTEMFTLNLTEHPQPNLNITSVTEPPAMEPQVFPNLNISIVSELTSPCQMPVTDPDVVIMCETGDIFCPTGSFCQIGMGQSICCPSTGGNPCYQPLQTGVGVAQLTRWYFNSATKHCETFIFGGFQGNENNFITFTDCQNLCSALNPCEMGQPIPASNPEQKCSTTNRCPLDAMCHSVRDNSACCSSTMPIVTTSKPKSDHNPCQQPIAEGNGGGAQHRWAFDQRAGRCVSFIYHGENGNLNNFLTKSDCQAICGVPPTVPSRCLQPGLSGDGEEYLARYFYSPEYRQCLHFIYSGKGGNENKFETQQECLETCIANGVKFSSLASTIPQATFSFSFHPAPVCPQGSPIQDANGDPLGCNINQVCHFQYGQYYFQCPNGYICTTMGPRQFCCPAPESFCLEPRPAVSVCPKGGSPVAQIRFTYDPMSDKCVRFSYKDCNPTLASLNSFSTQPQCSRLCCNQGYNLLYRRKVRMMLNDAPMDDLKRTKRI